MNQQDQLIQRFLDGELGAAQAAAVEHLLRDNPQASEHHRRLDHLGTLLRIHADDLRDDHQPLLSSIAERLPVAAPTRSQHISLLHLGLAAGIACMAVILFGLVGTRRDLINLSVLAGLSIAVGGLLLLCAQSLHASRRGWLANVLRMRFSVGRYDRLVYSTAGLLIVAGGIWLLLL